MSKPFLMLVWATGDEERPLEYTVFDGFVAPSLREDDQANDVATTLGAIVYRSLQIIIKSLTPAFGRRFLVISLDASKVRGDEAVLYANDLREVVEEAQTHAGIQPADSVLEFKSRKNQVAHGFLVPSTCLPSSVIQFVKEFKNCINDDVLFDVEKDLRAAVEEKFRLPEVERAALFERLFADLPEDFEGRAAALAEINEAFRQELAARFTPALNAHLKEAAPEDAETKKQLASDVMEKLTSLGLAVRCPVTGAASALNVWMGSGHPLGRFTIQPKGEKKPTIIRANIKDLLPLELVADRPRREALKELRASHTTEVEGKPAEG